MEIIEIYLTSVREAAREIEKREPFLTAMSVVVLAAVTRWLSGALVSGSGLTGAGLAGLAVTLLFAGFLWITLSACLHLVSELSGGEGRAKTLFILLGFSQLPALLILPFAFLTQAFGLSGLVFQGAVSVLGLWSLVLYVKSIQENYRFSSVKALFLGALPIVAIGLLIMGFLFVLTAFSIGHLAQGFAEKIKF